MRPAQLADHRLQLRRDLPRMGMHLMAAIRQARRALDPVADQPGMHALAAHPVPIGHLGHRNPGQHFQHRPVSLLGHAQLPQHERSVKHQTEPMCQASSGTAHERAGICANFLYVFKAARRAARAADTARSPLLPLALPLRRRRRRSAGAKAERQRAAIDSEVPGRGGFDKGTLAMAQIGLTGAGQKPARSPDSVRAIAPVKSAAPAAEASPICRLCGRTTILKCATIRSRDTSGQGPLRLNVNGGPVRTTPR